MDKPSGYSIYSSPYSVYSGAAQAAWLPSGKGIAVGKLGASGFALPGTAGRQVFPVVPVNSAFWSSGGWWDLYNIVGANNSQYSTVTPAQSLGALGSFTPASNSANKPVIYDTAIGGKRGLVLDYHEVNFLRNDALAPILNGLNKQWSVFFDFQANAINGAFSNDSVVVSWGSDAPGANQSLADVVYNVIGGGGQVTQSVSVLQQAGAGPTVTANNLSQIVAWDYFRFAASFNGVTLSTYINGVLSTVTPSTWQAAAMAITRFIWGARAVSGVGFQGSNGYIRRLGVRAVPSSPSEVAEVDSNMVGNDYTLPQTDPSTPNWIVAGASIINGSSDTVTGMGVRYFMSKFVQDNRLSWTTLGLNSGQYALRGCAATGGAGIVSITTQVSSLVNSRTKLVVLDLGNQEINDGGTAPSVIAAVTAALNNIRGIIYASAPSTCEIAVNTLCAYFDAPKNAVAQALNAALPGIWDSSDALFPARRKLRRSDFNAAMGGPAYNQPNYAGIGNDHPNNLGYSLIWANAMQAAVGPALIANSPT